MRAALEAGITTFDTADVYANGKAETILGDALAGERRESLEIFTKVYFPTGPRATNDTGLSRKHIHESINASLRRLQDRLRRPLPGAPLRPLHPAGGDDGGLRRRRPRRQGALHRGQRVDPRPAARRHALARELRIPFVSNQPQYNALYRMIEAEVVPTCRELGISQVVFSPIAQGMLTGKYQPGRAGARGLAGDRPEAARSSSRTC